MEKQSQWSDSHVFDDARRPGGKGSEDRDGEVVRPSCQFHFDFMRLHLLDGKSKDKK